MFLDGGMLTGSAYMREPWGVSKIYSIEDPQYKGMRYIEPGKLYRIARLALTNDFQMTANSVGDGAVHALIDAYEEVNSEFPVRDQRPCITHSNFMSLEAIQKMKRLANPLCSRPNRTRAGPPPSRPLFGAPMTLHSATRFKLVTLHRCGERATHRLDVPHRRLRLGGGQKIGASPRPDSLTTRYATGTCRTVRENDGKSSH